MDSSSNVAQKVYTAVMKADSSVRFEQDDGIARTFNDVRGGVSQVRIRVGTRWVDEGHESPVPRELWVEAIGPADTLNDVAVRFGSLGRYMVQMLSFTANVAAETPEVHIIFDSSAGETRRDFLEVFLPDERGHVRQGRIVKSATANVVLDAFQVAEERDRIGRAIHQYTHALRYWYFGGEALALAHLYMAVEALTRAATRNCCMVEGITEHELAAREGIEVNELDTWSRLHLIFDGDNPTFQATKYASDGFEHGFLDVSQVHQSAVELALTTFKYVRTAILKLLAIPEVTNERLYDVLPRDVRSFRRMIRGHFVGDGSDPAPADELYPRLEWLSSVASFTRSGDVFDLSFRERWTVRCAKAYGFLGEAVEVRGRMEPGQPATQYQRISALTNITPTATARTSLDDLKASLRRAHDFAGSVHRASGTSGLPAVNEGAFGIYVGAISLFEAVRVLLVDKRPVEAIVMLRPLILAAARLESISQNDNPGGIALRYKIDAIAELGTLFSEDLSQQVGEIQALAERFEVVIPDQVPAVEGAEFFVANAGSLSFAEALSRADYFSALLHARKDSAGNREMNTQIEDPDMAAGIAADAIDALVTAVEAVATVLDWEYDHAAVHRLRAEAQRLGTQRGEDVSLDKD